MIILIKFYSYVDFPTHLIYRCVMLLNDTWPVAKYFTILLTDTNDGLLHII